MARKKAAPTADRQPPPIVTITATPTRCPRCNSAKRAPYHHVRRLELGGQLRDGTSYSAVTWRRTHCTDCGQTRIDRSYELDAVPRGGTLEAAEQASDE